MAQKLGTISKALRELPNQSLVSFLQHLHDSTTKPPSRRRAQEASVLLPPPRDPRKMEREELKEYLSSNRYFPRKADLLRFAQRYEVPVNARTPREEMIRLCLRMIHDIPRGLNVLRFLADQREPMMFVPSMVLH